MIDADEEIDRIRSEWSLCTRCPLGAERKERYVVVGSGPSKAKYLLLYDSPSKEDTMFGEPMMNVHDASYLEIFEAAGLAREEIFIAPLVGCAPLHHVGETETTRATQIVRPPKAAEIEACQKRVYELIYAVDPRLIFTAGFLSWKLLVPSVHRLHITSISRAAGKLFNCYVPGREQPIRYPVMALLGPMEVVKNPSPAAHGPIGLTAAAVESAIRYVEYVEIMR